MLSEAVWTGQIRLRCKGFRLYSGHSHSILAGGLVVTASTALTAVKTANTVKTINSSVISMAYCLFRVLTSLERVYTACSKSVEKRMAPVGQALTHRWQNMHDPRSYW